MKQSQRNIRNYLEPTGQVIDLFQFNKPKRKKEEPKLPKPELQDRLQLMPIKINVKGCSCRCSKTTWYTQGVPWCANPRLRQILVVED
jgi:hypothetical protein